MALLPDYDELTVLAETIYEDKKDLPKDRRKQEIGDEVEELLLMCYAFGISRVQESAELSEKEAEAYRPSAERVYDNLYLPIAGETFRQRIERRIEEGTLTPETLARIVETDGHRCSETGAKETADIVSHETGKQGTKRWCTMLDPRVRDTHDYLESREIPIDEEFVTFDGDSAMFPGDFGLPENNINCRCWLSYKFK